MMPPEHNERSDESETETSGLHASSPEEEKKKRKCCLADVQLKRQKIDLKRKISDDEESEPRDKRTKGLETSEIYQASGLKSSLHGVAYQLKLLMLFLKRGIDQGYTFRLATEMDAAGKFDDVVFEYEDEGRKVHRLLQAKHKLNEAEQISINDLLTDTKKKLSLKIYFESYREIKNNPKFNGINHELKDLVIYTNIGFKWGDKQGALTLSDDIFHRERDDTILKTDLRRFKKEFRGREEIVSVLENTTDLIKLAKNLANYVLNDEYVEKGEAKKRRSDDILESYRSPLKKEVIDGDRKKFCPEFVICAEGLSQEAKNLRQAIEKVFRDQRKTYNLHPNPVIKREDLDEFAQVVAALIQEGDGSGIINIDKRKNIIKENFDKLAGYVLVQTAGKIRFSLAFLNKHKLPGNLKKFRKKLLAELLKKNITFRDITEYTFQVYEGFQTCDEIYVNMNPEDMNTFWEVIGEREFDVFDNSSTRNAVNMSVECKLPSDSITDIDSEIDSFLDKLVFAVNQLNEIKLGNIIAAEMQKWRGDNLIDSKFSVSHFQRYVLDWMKHKNGVFLTCDKVKDFFDEMAKELTTLQLTWPTQEHSVHMQQINIRFTKDEIELRKFLEPENTTQLFILISMPNTILGVIQVHQILEKIPDYRNDDGYIFLRWNSFLRMQGPVVDAIASRSKRLLIIECKSGEVNEQASYTESLKAIKSNTMRKIILITEKDGTPVDQFKRIFGYRFVEKKVEVDSLLDLEDESREKIIEERSLTFQGQEVPLSKLMINKESMKLINAEALAKLINNETLEIGKCLEDLGDVGNYYIRRTLQRPAKINRCLMEDESRFYVATDNQLRGFDSQRNQDIVVISDKNKLLKELSIEENCKHHNIHWLKSENKQFIWQESNGTVSNLRNFVDSDSVEPFTPKKVTDISNKIAIIAAKPGMGKSTMLTHLSVQTKISEPTVWVAKVNLSVDCSKELEAMDGEIIFDDEKTIDFLLASAKFTSEMPEYQFLNYYYKTGNMILLFDGFDEISPHYNKKVIKLLKFLKGTEVKKIWVTTRPYDIKTNLEDELGSFSYVLKEFSKADQENFLRAFWKAKSNPDKFNDRRANIFIDTLLKSFSKSINDCQRKFISIPLQIQMIADVCEKTFQNFIESDGENIADLEKKLEENLELLSLYKNFFEEKFSIVFKEKQPNFNTAIPISRGVMDQARVEAVETQEILALENLHPNNSFISRKKVICLLKDIKRSRNKTGIIDSVVDDKPVFVHKSFAEYFVALWFSKNWRQENVKQLLKERIFSEESIVIRNFFDRMLANNELESSESQEYSTEHPESADVYKLHNAVLNNDGSGVQKLLDDDESLFNKTDAAGRNLLHLAAAYGHEEIVRSCLEAVRERADHIVVTHPLSVKDELFQWTPLTYADKCNHWNVAELFLQTGYAGEDMFIDMENIETSRGSYNEETSLHRVAREGYLKIAELLLNKGVKIDVLDGKEGTPLHSAARAGHLGIVQYFISQHDANFEAVDKFGRTVLHIAGQEGYWKIVEYFVDEKYANFEAADKFGRTVLHIAARKGYLRIVKYLVDEKNANFEAADKLGRTVLHIAAQKGYLEMVKYLVDEKNANFEAADKSGQTVLYYAILGRKFKIVNYLVDEKNANLDAVDESGRTILHIAAQKGDLAMVKFLVDEKNANFEAADESGRTVLHIAAENGKLELVKYLGDEKNANFEAADKSGRTVLHIAAQKGDLAMVKFLVDEKNANFEAADESGRTVLHIAAENGKLELVKYLGDEKNANFEAADKSGRTVLHIAAENGKLELVKYLIDGRNANFEAVDKSGCTVLHIAAENGKLELVKYLIDERNANFEAADESGRTALHIAAEDGKLELVKYLTDEKRNANFEAADRFGRTVLHIAARKGYLEMVKYLVDEKNANFEAADESGLTVLHIAAQEGYLEMVKYLVDEKNANFEVADASGRTVLHIAAQKGYLKIVKYFVDEKNANIDAADESGRTVLHIAAQKDCWRFVKYLVNKKNANIETADKLGCTVLHIAAQKKYWSFVEYLVNKKNANFKAADESGRTVLHIAVQEGNLRMVEYLVDKKDANGKLELVKYLTDERNANIEAADESGRTVLQ